MADNLQQGGEPNDLVDFSTVGEFRLGFSLVENPGIATVTQIPAGSSQLGVDPQLGGLADNGGQTATQPIAASSPAIDAGIAGGQQTDQRGLQRTQEQPGPNRTGSDGTDIGAFELPATATVEPPGTIDPPATIDPSDTVLDSPTVSARRTQQVKGRKVVVRVAAGAGERVTTHASGAIRAGGTVALKPVEADVEPGAAKVLSLKPQRKRGAGKVIRLLAKGKRARARITVALTDASGNSVTKDVRVSLTAGRGKRK